MLWILGVWLIKFMYHNSFYSNQSIVLCITSLYQLRKQNNIQSITLCSKDIRDCESTDFSSDYMFYLLASSDYGIWGNWVILM